MPENATSQIILANNAADMENEDITVLYDQFQCNHLIRAQLRLIAFGYTLRSPRRIFTCNKKQGKTLGHMQYEAAVFGILHITPRKYY